MKRIFLLALCLFSLLGCGKSEVPENALAKYDKGYITQHDLELFLKHLDKKRLKQQATVSEDKGQRELLEKVAYLHIMADMVKEKEIKSDNHLLRPSLFARLQVLYYKQKEGKRSHEVTDEEISQRYQAYIESRFTLPEMITFRHIFLRSDKHSKEEIHRIEQQIFNGLKNQQDFANLAQRYSDSSSSKDGGKVGPMFRGKLEDSFEKQLYPHKDLRTPFLIRTPKGDHIVLILDHQPKRLIPQEEVRSQIASAIMSERDEQERIKLFADLYDHFQVRFRPENLLADKGSVIEIGTKTLTSQDIEDYISGLPKRQQVILRQHDQLKGFVQSRLNDHLLFLHAQDMKLQDEETFKEIWAWNQLNLKYQKAQQQAIKEWGQGLAKEQVLEYYEAHKNRFFQARMFDLAFAYFPFGKVPPFEVLKNAEIIRTQWLSKGNADNALIKLIRDCHGYFHDLGPTENRKTAFFGPVFQKTLKSLHPGEFSEPIKTVNGLYLIHLRKSSDQRALTPDKDFEAIKTRYLELQRDDYLKQHKTLILNSHNFEIIK